MRKKHNAKRSKKIRNLVAICCLFAILLSASTYAWFIGMKTVSVDKFDIDIATTEGLFLSMDGENWSYSLNPKTATAYLNNANTWADDGLIPMSSVGDMDAEASRMKLYEKASLTAVPGGYRFLASRVNNYTDTEETSGEFLEGKGYVAFDLFIKNLSGAAYYEENNPLNEEAVYLTYNSEVKVSDTGGVQNTGIENSVRVGIVQLGRVIGDGSVEPSVVTGITCADDEENGVTGICRNAQIWEPNDTDHVTNAINWYDKSCLPRNDDGTDVTSKDSYDSSGDTTCTEVVNGTGYKTFAISRDLAVADNVNIYDGDYNTYTENTMTYSDYLLEEEDGEGVRTGAKLVDFPYFTDSIKENNKGENRVQFMTLAPNSITKLRVYIWIEGQDIDNYDFAQLGKQISVNFGFTKERYEETDFGGGYDGPSTDITGTTFSYEAAGEVVLSEEAIAAGVQYNTSNKGFIIPKDYTTEFTFTDDGDPKTATYADGTWSVS